MIGNRYFILPLPNVHSSLWGIVVEDENNVCKNLLGTKMVVKLPLGDEASHPILNGKQEYTHAEIIVELSKPEWQSDVV